MRDDDKPGSPWTRARTPRPAWTARAGEAPRAASRDASPPRAPVTGTRENTGRDAARPAAREQRIYGLNACLAAFAHRPDALRKAYLSEARIPALKAVLAWCVQRRIGYRIVEAADLDRLTSSRHHEGVCFDLLRPEPLTLPALLATQPAPPAPSLLLWLDGVGNPHNLGALLRTSAHFGAAGVLVPADAGLDVSGAAARVAEGAAEIVPLVAVAAVGDALAALRTHGYAVAATTPHDGVSLYGTALPPRLLLVLGAEGEGISTAMHDAADLRLTIPGSGAIESLNVAASVAVLLGEYWRSVKTRSP